MFSVQLVWLQVSNPQRLLFPHIDISSENPKAQRNRHGHRWYADPSWIAAWITPNTRQNSNRARANAASSYKWRGWRVMISPHWLIFTNYEMVVASGWRSRLAYSPMFSMKIPFGYLRNIYTKDPQVMLYNLSLWGKNLIVNVISQLNKHDI